MTYDDFIKINGIGPERAKILVDGLDENLNNINKLLEILPIKGEKNMNGNGVGGKIFTLTGKMPMGRKEITKMIEGKGGEVKGISMNTNYLVCDDPGSGSGKVKKAMEYGTMIIRFDQLMGMLN
jgi:NAD-dependent DNA ligase